MESVVLPQIRDEKPETRNVVFTLLARFFSYIFHPLFIPLYVCAYLIYLHPYAFAVLDDKQKLLRLMTIFVSTTLLPAFTVFLLWRLGFANSIMLRTQKERIIPYVASLTFFWWMFYVSKNIPVTSSYMTFFFFGIFICTSIALIANNFFKISMHALGMGGALAFMILVGLVSGEAMGLPIAIATVATGIVCTSRFLVSDHSPFEVYFGLVLGVLCQVIACWLFV